MSAPAETSPVGLPRWYAAGEWLLVSGLMGTVAWTTLCLGGYLAETMVVTCWAVFGLAMLGGALWLTAPQGLVRQLNRTVLLPVPFLVYALGSVLWLAPAKWLAWREWLLWVQMWLVFALSLHFGRSRRHTALIVGTLVLLGLTGIGMAAYQRYADGSWMMLGRTQFDQYGGRSSGMFGIPNSLAALLELMIPAGCTAVLARSTKPGVKILCGMMVMVFVFGLVLTGSRGAWISLSLALMLWPLLSGSNWRKKILGAGLMLGMAAAGVWALFAFSPEARERIQPFLDGRFETTRPVMWKIALRIWHDHPWLGSGAGSYYVVFDQYRPAGTRFHADWAHNDYLNTLSDYGLLGCALWGVAGGTLLVCGWRVVIGMRDLEQQSREVGERQPWRLGLLLGLLAFSLHLAVDFHTKIPALAFSLALLMALLLRDEPAFMRLISARGVRLAAVGLMFVCGLLVWRVAVPLYQGEALRSDSRDRIDHLAATGKGDLRVIIPAARQNFAEAVSIDPRNAQAWADLSYAIVQNWHVAGGSLRMIGKEAEAPARRALALCAVNAEYWVRLGNALDMQARQDEGEPCFRRALELAPHTAAWWYYYAYHLQARPNRKAEAKEALATCLSLDPYNRAGISMQQQLGANR